MKRYAFLFSIMISTACVAAQARESDEIVGVWKSGDQQLMVKIDKVGNYFQGRIVWLGDSDENGMKLDENNPDEQLRSLPLKGNKIIEGMTFNPSATHWEGGTFYNHTEGKSYHCTIAMQSADQMKIATFVQSRQDGKTDIWTRAR
jgi:uncharacterized protein (DUF2147 family)